MTPFVIVNFQHRQYLEVMYLSPNAKDEKDPLKRSNALAPGGGESRDRSYKLPGLPLPTDHLNAAMSKAGNDLASQVQIDTNIRKMKKTQVERRRHPRRRRRYRKSPQFRGCLFYQLPSFRLRGSVI
jgi:hypothetical protein